MQLRRKKEEGREWKTGTNFILHFLCAPFMTRVANEAKLPPVCCESMDFSLSTAKNIGTGMG